MMCFMASSIRDRLVERLTAEFGEPWRIGQNFRWSIGRAQHAPINISLDSWRTEGCVAVWVFNPAGDKTSDVWHMKVEHPHQIDEFVGKLRSQLPEPA